MSSAGAGDLLEKKLAAEAAPEKRRGPGRGRYYLLILSLCAAMMLLALHLFNADPSAVGLLIMENGPIELMSAAGYLICILAIALLGGLSFVWRTYYMSVLLLFLALRESDFHVRFTTMGVFKTKFYISPEVPLVEKFVATAVILFLVWCGVRLVAAHWRRFVDGLLALHPAALSFLLACGGLVASKLFDGSQQKFAQIGIEIGNETELSLYYLEEVLELGAPLLLITAAIAFFHLRRRSAHLP